MDHAKIRTDNHDNDLFLDHSSVLPKHNRSVKAEDEMQPIIKMEVYPEFPAIIEFGNEAVPKLEPFGEIIMPAGEVEVNDNDCNYDEDINELFVQREVPLSGLVAESHRRSCPYCAFASLSDSVYMATHSMDLHLVRYHPEHYFPDERSKATAAGMALENFQRILIETLLPKYILKAGTMASCSFCSREYRSRSFAGNRRMLQKHLLCTHPKKLKKGLLPILKRRIRTLEKTPPPASTTNSTRNTSVSWMSSDRIDDESENLIDTQSIFITEAVSKLENADADHDPLAETDIDVDGTQRQEDPRPKCSYCGFEHFCGNPSRLSDAIEMHHVRYHPEHYFPVEKERAVHECGWKQEEFQIHFTDTLLPQFIFKSEKLKWSCSLCPKKKMYTQRDRYRVQHHLILMHNAEMKRQIWMSIKGQIQGKKRKTKKTGSQSKDSFMSDFVSCLRPTGISRCFHCGTPCTKKKLKDHRMQFHPDLYFRKEQEKASALGFQPEQFQHILKNSLFPQFVIRAGNVRNCSLCDVYSVARN